MPPRGCRRKAEDSTRFNTTGRDGDDSAETEVTAPSLVHQPVFLAHGSCYLVKIVILGSIYQSIICKEETQVRVTKPSRRQGEGSMYARDGRCISAKETATMDLCYMDQEQRLVYRPEGCSLARGLSGDCLGVFTDISRWYTI